MHRFLRFVLLAGCAPTTYAYTPATGKPETTKPENCAIEVFLSPPSKNYEQLGTLDYYNGGEPKNAEEFKKAVAKQACQAGGDAVIAIVDDKGRYTKGTVIHYVPEPATIVQPMEKPTEKPAEKTTAKPAAKKK